MEKLEAKLLKEGWVTSNQFVTAKGEQKNINKSLYSVLIKLGYLSEEKVYMFFAQNSNIPFVKVTDYDLDSELVNLFSEQSYREHLFLPLFKMDNTLYVCMANPLDAGFMGTLEMQAKCDISPLFGCPSEILQAINRFFGPDDKYFDLEDLIVSPQTLELMPFGRESERLPLRIPLEFKITDDRIKLASSSYISATTWDISGSGKALGIKTSMFIPPYTNMLVKFPSKDESYEALAEVTRCHLQKGGEYFIGVKFLQMRDDLLQEFLKQADKSPQE